jgi:hypothetical protein
MPPSLGQADAPGQLYGPFPQRLNASPLQCFGGDFISGNFAFFIHLIFSFFNYRAAPGRSRVDSRLL